MIFGKKSNKNSKNKKSTANTKKTNGTASNRPSQTSGGRTHSSGERTGTASRQSTSGYGTTSRQTGYGTTSHQGYSSGYQGGTYSPGGSTGYGGVGGTQNRQTGSSGSGSKQTGRKPEQKKKKRSNINPVDIIKNIFGALILHPTTGTKLGLFFVVSILIMIGLIGRIAYWKINYGKEYEANAINNQVNKVNNKVISPNRGDILDRNNEQLAVGETVFNIILDVRILMEQDEIDQNDMAKFKSKVDEAKTADEREKAQEKYEAVVADSAMVKTKKALQDICGITEAQFNEFVAKDENGNLKNDTSYLTIAKKIPYDKGKEINDLSYNWLYGEQDTKRSYPYGTLAAQVIGYIRGDSMSGLESYYNTEMTGTPGRVYRTYESDNSVMTQQVAPQKGNTLITTLDVNMQQFADEACKEAYNAYNPEFTSTIIMNPNTGEVYAMAQYPSFDCNDPMSLTDFSDQAKKTAFDAATEADQLKMANKAWKNVAISETFEPGSIFKPIVAAMALEEGVISANDSFYCGGSKKYGGYEIHCHNRYGHGALSLEQVLAQSCNVGMMTIMDKLGKDLYYKYRNEFGYTQKTGIDLPGETAADSKYLNYSYDNLNQTELATCSFGQGFNVTAMQSLIAFNAVINGGNIMQPYIVSQIVDQDGNVVKENEPHVVRKILSQDTSDTMKRLLEAVVKPNATGKKAVIQGYAIGGKTGTAQQGTRIDNGGDYTLNFIGYHSVENPDICVMTIIHKPPNYSDTSGISAAPMLKEVFEKIINYESIPPDYEGQAETTVDVNSITVKDYENSNLKTVIEELNSLNIGYTIIGNGDTVIKQAPVAGTKITPGVDGEKILLNVTNSGKKTLATIPDVTGLSESAAKQTLEAAGFKCYIQSSSYDDDGGDDDDITSYITKTETSSSDTEEEDTTKSEAEVISQMPAADIKIEKGTTVKITVG